MKKGEVKGFSKEFIARVKDNISMCKLTFEFTNKDVIFYNNDLEGFSLSVTCNLGLPNTIDDPFICKEEIFANNIDELLSRSAGLLEKLKNK